MWITIAVFLSITDLSFNMVQSLNLNDSLSCETYNGLTCKSENKDECVKQETCGPTGHEKRYHCFTLWEYNVYQNTSTVQMKGCFLNHKGCFEQSHCIQKNKDEVNQLFFCCCSGNMCNQNITEPTYLKKRQKNSTIEVETKRHTMRTEEVIIFMCASTLVLASTLSIVAWCLYKCAKRCGNDLSKAEEGLSCSIATASLQTPLQYRGRIACIELLEKKAYGRFGSVWLAQHRCYPETLAVKVFPLSGRDSWQSELEVLKVPGLKHENLLQLIAAGRRGQGLDMEFWLVANYYEKGSLSDVLIGSLISWGELCRIAIGMLSGLAYLHRKIDLPNSLSSVYKPAIVHRDFKSQNVLISGDMRACVADFGLAVVFGPPDESDAVNELRQKQRVSLAGTPRYMAPELLVGAMDCRRIDAYRATDVYACALVLWELMSRCSNVPDINIEYELPLERELGLETTMGHIYDYVVEENGRPFIPDSWREQSSSSSMCEIIEDCWDKDPDARLSSACILDRIKVLKNDCFDIMNQSTKSSCKWTSR